MVKHPYEHVLKFEGLKKLDTGRAKIRRSKHGCFNCRKRKKKCDEQKPSCSSCLSKCISCVWPKDGGDKLPKEYNVPKADNVKLRARRASSFIPVNFDTTFAVELGDETKSEKAGSPINFIDDTEENALIPIYESDQDVGELIDNFGSPDSTDFSLDLENSSISSYKVTFQNYFTQDTDQKFILACTNGFIESVGPQYTHPLLTTTATFSPYCSKNAITQQVAAACGCAFLSWQNPELRDLSAKKYNIAFNALTDYMKQNDTFYMDNWVGAAFQLMCLCSKITYSGEATSSVIHLANSYKIIKMKFLTTSKYYKQRQKSISDSNTDSQKSITNYLEDFKSDNLKMEIENSLIHLDRYNSDYVDSHFEKMFVESFIYNYSIALLVSENYYLLPNPFEVFKELRHLLKTPLLTCDVAWMNNPVFGASLDAYELAAKASYLLRNLNDPLMLVTAKKLYDIASFYPSPMIPPEIRIDSIKYKNLRDSVLLAEIVAKVAKILLRKLIIPEITEMDSVIQKDMNLIMFKLKLIAPDSKVKVISCWPLLIAGAASVKEEHRELLTQSLVEVASLTHGHHVYTIMDALDIAWGKSPECEEIKTRGLDILFDRRVLNKVIL